MQAGPTAVMQIDWASSVEFGALCDLAASDHLVCLTGAGISRGMLRAHPQPGADRTLPGWLALLRELLAAFESQMTPPDVSSARRLLAPDDERPAARFLEDAVRESLTGATKSEALRCLQAVGPHIGSSELILAASLIRTPDPPEFDRRFRLAITEAPGQCTDTHLAILELLPRGILTFNYDGGHEESLRRRKRACLVVNPTDPESEEDFRSLLKRRLSDFFLLKAHGSVNSTRPLVLTTEDYRNLLAKNPSFRAFVQNLFTNYSFLMVGYGLDDPDFDLFLSTMAEQFADPLQQHIVLRPITQTHRREVVERQRYGIHTLHVNDFEEIPIVLQRAASTAGPRLTRNLADCLSASHDRRQAGHAALSELGPAGRAVAGRVLLDRLDDEDSFTISEAAYSLGLLDAKGHKDRLCELIDTRREADILGRTLTVLRSALEPTDLPRLADWLARFTATPAVGPRAGRIVAYLRYLLVYVEHKYQSDAAPGGT